MVYLMRIHPQHWVVFTNRRDLADPVWLSAYLVRLQEVLWNLGVEVSNDLNQVKSRFIDGTVPIGNKYPLLRISHNNMAEGGASQVNGLGIHSLSPIFAVHKFLLSAKKALAKYHKEVEDIDPLHIPFTSIGIKLFQDSIRDNSVEVVTTIQDQATYGLFHLQVQLGRKVNNV
jgi:hypothetical protein